MTKQQDLKILFYFLDLKDFKILCSKTMVKEWNKLTYQYFAWNAEIMHTLKKINTKELNFITASS